MDKSCIFCNIVSGEVPAHKVWEDEAHMAFLSIFPNTPGATVVIPKKHIPSYVFDADDAAISALVLAAKRVAKKIDAAFDDVGRTGMIFEGFGVDHLHAKLFPMHGTADMEKWKPIENKRTEFYQTYPGFLSSHDADRADDAELERIAKLVRSA